MSQMVQFLRASNKTVIARQRTAVIPECSNRESMDPRLKHSGMTLRVRLLRRTDRPAPENQAAVRRSTNRRRFAPRNDDVLKVLLSVLSTFLLIPFLVGSLYASEVIEGTHTRVVIREHPKTGKPYVSIVSGDQPVAEDPFVKLRKKTSRPNYRMLDPKVKPGKIPYDGPYSSSTKIYVFAATLATLGVAGGAVGLAAIPASTGGAASGGGAYLAAGSAVAVGTAGAAVVQTRNNPNQDDFTLVSKSKSLDLEGEKKSSDATSSKESE